MKTNYKIHIMGMVIVVVLGMFLKLGMIRFEIVLETLLGITVVIVVLFCILLPIKIFLGADPSLLKTISFMGYIFVCSVLALFVYGIILLSGWWAVIVLPITAILLLFLMKKIKKDKKIIIIPLEPLIARMDKIIGKIKFF